MSEAFTISNIHMKVVVYVGMGMGVGVGVRACVLVCTLLSLLYIYAEKYNISRLSERDPIRLEH